MNNDIDISVEIKANLYWKHPVKNKVEEIMRNNLQTILSSSVINLEEGLRKFLIEHYDIMQKS